MLIFTQTHYLCTNKIHFLRITKGNTAETRSGLNFLLHNQRKMNFKKSFCSHNCYYCWAIEVKILWGFSDLSGHFKITACYVHPSLKGYGLYKLEHNVIQILSFCQNISIFGYIFWDLIGSDILVWKVPFISLALSNKPHPKIYNFWNAAAC